MTPNERRKLGPSAAEAVTIPDRHLRELNRPGITLCIDLLDLNPSEQVVNGFSGRFAGSDQWRSISKGNLPASITTKIENEKFLPEMYQV
jgi:hypothetical protein